MTRRITLAAAAVLAASVVVTPARAADTPAFVFGSAAASCSVARARLFYGGLSLPLGVGTTSASYKNQQSKALAGALDLGAYVGLAGDVPPQATPAVVDSNSGDRESKGNLDAGEAVARVQLKATSVPASSSEVNMADVDLPALVRVQGAHAVSRTEVKDGRQRRAAATVEVARVTIAGVVVLENLAWTATQVTGFEPVASAAFRIGSAAIAGVPIPVAGADLNTGLAAINNALKPVGLRVEAPKLTKTSEGIVSISPLRVALADSQLGAQLLGPIIASARPLLAPVLDQVTDLNKTLGLVGLVADIVLGVADGSGGVELSVGGATAATSAVGFVAPAEPAAAPTVAVALPDTSVGARSPLTNLGDTLAPLKDVRETAAPASVSKSVRCALEAAPRRSGDCRDGNLPLALGIAGIAAVGLGAAEFGVRRRRRAAGVAQVAA